MIPLARRVPNRGVRNALPMADLIGPDDGNGKPPLVAIRAIATAAFYPTALTRRCGATRARGAGEGTAASSFSHASGRPLGTVAEGRMRELL